MLSKTVLLGSQIWHLIAGDIKLILLVKSVLAPAIHIGVQNFDTSNDFEIIVVGIVAFSQKIYIK